MSSTGCSTWRNEKPTQITGSSNEGVDSRGTQESSETKRLESTLQYYRHPTGRPNCAGGNLPRRTRIWPASAATKEQAKHGLVETNISYTL